MPRASHLWHVEHVSVWVACWLVLRLLIDTSTWLDLPALYGPPGLGDGEDALAEPQRSATWTAPGLPGVPRLTAQSDIRTV